MPTPRLRALSAGIPLGRVARGCACCCGTYRGWAFSTSYLQGARLGRLEVTYPLHVKPHNGLQSLFPNFVLGDL